MMNNNTSIQEIINNEEPIKIIRFRDNNKVKIPMKMWGDEYHTKLYLLNKKTLEEFPWGHVQATIYGKKRVGKSIYVIKSMMEQNQLLFNMNEEDAFNLAIKRTYFSVREFVDDIRIVQRTDEYIPSCHIDDAGSGFSRYLWNKKGGRTLAQELQGVLETIGSRVIGLYMTCASVDSVLSFLQSYEGKIVHIIKNTRFEHPYDRVAKFYRWNALPSGTMRIDQIVEEDPYNVYLQDKYFKVYWAIRETYLSKNLDLLDEAERQLSTVNADRNLVNRVLKILSARLDNAASLS